MYTYKSIEYEPKIQDFGDDYHQPIELEEKLRSDKSLLSRVKKIKRRYRNYFEYNRAMKTYEEYVIFLMDKYNGLENFRRMMVLQEIDDYIPYKPELRMTMENKRLLKLGVSDFNNKWIEEEIDPSPYINNSNPSSVQYMFKDMKKKKSISMLSLLDNCKLTSEQILGQLSLMDNYYRSTRITKRNMRQYKKDLLKIKYSRYKKNDDGISSKFDEVEEMKMRMKFGENPIADNEDIIIQYKGLSLRADVIEELDVKDSITGIGLDYDAKKSSKRAFKVIRKDKQAKKIEKKLKKKMNKKTRDFTGRGYDSYEDLERELCQLNGVDILEI